MYLFIDKGTQVYHVITMYKLGSHDTYININIYLCTHTHTHTHSHTYALIYTYKPKTP